MNIIAPKKLIETYVPLEALARAAAIGGVKAHGEDDGARFCGIRSE